MAVESVSPAIAAARRWGLMKKSKGDINFIYYMSIGDVAKVADQLNRLQGWAQNNGCHIEGKARLLTDLMDDRERTLEQFLREFDREETRVKKAAGLIAEDSPMDDQK